MNTENSKKYFVFSVCVFYLSEFDKNLWFSHSCSKLLGRRLSFQVVGYCLFIFQFHVSVFFFHYYLFSEFFFFCVIFLNWIYRKEKEKRRLVIYESFVCSKPINFGAIYVLFRFLLTMISIFVIFK